MLRLFIQKDFIKLTTPLSSPLPTQGMNRLRVGSWAMSRAMVYLKVKKSNLTHGSVGAEPLGGILCSHLKRFFFWVIFTELWVCPQTLGPQCQMGPGSHPRSGP